MPFPTGYEMSVRDWQQLQLVLVQQATIDGIDSSDAGAMLELMRTGFDIIADSGLRTRYLNNAAHPVLAVKETEAEAELARVQGEIARLPPDPGPVPPK